MNSTDKRSYDVNNNPYHIYNQLLGTLHTLRVISQEEWDDLFHRINADDLIRMFEKVRSGWGESL